MWFLVVNGVVTRINFVSNLLFSIQLLCIENSTPTDGQPHPSGKKNVGFIIPVWNNWKSSKRNWKWFATHVDSPLSIASPSSVRITQKKRCGETRHFLPPSSPHAAAPVGRLKALERSIKVVTKKGFDQDLSNKTWGFKWQYHLDHFAPAYPKNFRLWNDVECPFFEALDWREQGLKNWKG